MIEQLYLVYIPGLLKQILFGLGIDNLAHKELVVAKFANVSQAAFKIANAFPD